MFQGFSINFTVNFNSTYIDACKVDGKKGTLKFKEKGMPKWGCTFEQEFTPSVSGKNYKCFIYLFSYLKLSRNWIIYLKIMVFFPPNCHYCGPCLCMSLKNTMIRTNQNKILLPLFDRTQMLTDLSSLEKKSLKQLYIIYV